MAKEEILENVEQFKLKDHIEKPQTNMHWIHVALDLFLIGLIVFAFVYGEFNKVYVVHEYEGNVMRIEKVTEYRYLKAIKIMKDQDKITQQNWKELGKQGIIKEYDEMEVIK